MGVHFHFGTPQVVLVADRSPNRTELNNNHKDDTSENTAVSEAEK